MNKSDSERQILYDLLYVELRNYRLVVARGWREGEVKWGTIGQSIRISSCKVSEFWGSNVRDGDYS